MREIRLSGSEGGGVDVNRPSLPLSLEFLHWGNIKARGADRQSLLSKLAPNLLFGHAKPLIIKTRT